MLFFNTHTGDVPRQSKILFTCGIGYKVRMLIEQCRTEMYGKQMETMFVEITISSKNFPDI